MADLVELRARGSIAVGDSPSGIRAHSRRNEIWGVSTSGGYVWVISNGPADLSAEAAAQDDAAKAEEQS